MPAEDRDNPVRHPSSESELSLMEFMREYPDDAACLDRLWRDRFAPDGHHAHCPRCERKRKFHRTRTRASYTCDTCGLHIHPMKGTIFQKSTTSLHQWFYAMYLMAGTRCGISAKQLERELGVAYKTAHRMMKKIRTELMNDLDDEPLSGDVEIDETSWGGKARRPMDRFEAAAFRESKPTVLEMVERGGRVRARVIASRRRAPPGDVLIAASAQEASAGVLHYNARGFDKLAKVLAFESVPAARPGTFERRHSRQALGMGADPHPDRSGDATPTQQTKPAKGDPIEIPVPKRSTWERLLGRATHPRPVPDEASKDEQAAEDHERPRADA